ncbi:MAG: hypothetical protein IPJ71_19445 [Bdellovibrionales bacterium]|nr:hypothetical protein [Bdellovibrionales bacterium]
MDFIKKTVDRDNKIQPILHRFLSSHCVDGYGLGYVLGLQKITPKTYPHTYPSNSYPIEMKCVLGSGFGYSQSQDHPPPTSNWGRVVLRTPEPFGRVPKIGIKTGGEVNEMRIIFEDTTKIDAQRKT